MVRDYVCVREPWRRALVVPAVLALLTFGAGCGGGGDEEAEAETPKTALVPGALDDTLRTTADTSAWYQMGGTDADDSGLSSPTGEDAQAGPGAGEEVARDGASQGRSSPPPSSAMAAPEGDFILQLGSFQDEANARRQVDRIRELGHQPAIEVSDLGGQTYHRVVLRGLPDQSAASALGERIHAELGITYLVRRAR